MDSMLQKLEKYAENLEDIVQQRTALLVDEKHKTDMLLYRMLPSYAFLIVIVTVDFLHAKQPQVLSLFPWTEVCITADGQ